MRTRSRRLLDPSVVGSYVREAAGTPVPAAQRDARPVSIVGVVEIGGRSRDSNGVSCFAVLGASAFVALAACAVWLDVFHPVHI